MYTNRSQRQPSLHGIHHLRTEFIYYELFPHTFIQGNYVGESRILTCDFNFRKTSMRYFHVRG